MHGRLRSRHWNNGIIAAPDNCVAGAVGPLSAVRVATRAALLHLELLDGWPLRTASSTAAALGSAVMFRAESPCGPFPLAPARAGADEQGRHAPPGVPLGRSSCRS